MVGENNLPGALWRESSTMGNGWTGDGRDGVESSATITRRGFVHAGLAALAPAWLSACAPEPTGPSGPVSEGARLFARPGEPTTAATPGVDWLNINTTGRDARLFVPTDYDPAVPAPLLVTLHGRGGSALDWDGFHPACEARNLILLAIDSRGVTWDRIGGFYGPDVAYIERALTQTFDQCAIDPDRICLAGFSDGASYALSLGPSNGDLFQHIIAFSPGLSAPAQEVFGLPRMWISHGRDDAILSSRRTEEVIVAGLIESGYLVTYVGFEGGHEVPADIATSALDWFLS
jgi:phospholipase/carboxylesterase